MIRGLNAAGAAMRTLTQRMDTVAENMSNAQTPGFRRLLLSMSTAGENEMFRVEGGEEVSIGTTNLGINTGQIYLDTTPAPLQETGSPLDLAIRGAGYFLVKDDDGNTHLSRGGSLHVDADGYLVTSNGDRLQGAGGDIKPDTEQFIVRPNGTIVVNGATLDRLKMANPPIESIMSMGEGRYSFNGQGVGDFTTEVDQGSLEMANVDMAKEMTSMMEAVRSYETCQKFVQMVDETLGKAVNEVGRV